MADAPLFPVYLRLDGRTALVVGAGSVATRKVRSLLPTGAHVKVVAPEVSSEIDGLSDEGNITLIRRRFEPSDMEGVDIAFCATDDEGVSEEVHGIATDMSIPVNVVDVPELCSFYVPSVLKRGGLQIAVSTSGAAPSVARDVRRSLEEVFPDWWEGHIDDLAELRCTVRDMASGGDGARAGLDLEDSATRAKLLECAASISRGSYEQDEPLSPDEVLCRAIEAMAEEEPSWR